MIVAEVGRALDVEAAVALPGRGADKLGPLQRDRLRIKTLGVACHERHAGDADDVGFPAGQRQDALTTATDHDRRVRPAGFCTGRGRPAYPRTWTKSPE